MQWVFQRLRRDNGGRWLRARVPPGCLLALMAILATSGCKSASSRVDRGCIQSDLAQRGFHELSTKACPGEISVPPTVNIEDGLSEEEAVAIALWNNRAFLAALSNLGIARGDLVQAGLLTNPQLNILFPPIGSKQLEWTVYAPIEALLLRRRRLEIADRDFQRIANELVQNGLDVARDARVAYANYVFATDRYSIAQEAVEIRTAIAELAQKRFDAGDTGELEVISTRIDVNRGRADAAGFRQAVSVAEARLRNVLGIATLDISLFPTAEVPPTEFDFDVDQLVSEALLIRPDVRAARIAAEAANYRVELARKSFLRVDAVADGNSGGAGHTNSGPGLRLEVPIFNRNQGLIIRSQWTVDQANHNYFAICDQVITDVRTSFGMLEQARLTLNLLKSDVLPVLSDSVQIAEAAYGDGGVGYFLVLQSTSQFLDARVQELQLTTDLRRAVAELERSVGRRVLSNVRPPERLPPPTEELSSTTSDFDADHFASPPVAPEPSDTDPL